ncbi:N-acetylmuramoyl-L-alanine amidase [Kineothrix alysoides]|jgi:N-acetylmuramoyl-L-alanine amidase|uniref:N-acetylmuramoyl-L-alanine amidase n=1 Tax=Kineothrix alysoides TaxID=1469948 RepID=A0A4R1R3U0_9FIRM|nr:N-acetylmuramoyl-L-alanine amidase [Kineothrix alysoides]TCL60104.1 N-acetylmuramoyl-L-alanine amidase [Kineothrix alysoides]
MAYTVVLDAGHGGANPGAVYNGRQEKDDTLRLTLAIGQLLENAGINVVYTRTTDIYESPAQKAAEANQAGADFFVSIHRNSSVYPNQYTGIETLVYSLYGPAAEMAANINENLEALGFVNHGVNERTNLIVLNQTQMPSLLVEVGFINNEQDNALFDSRFQEIAQAIADGIIDTLNTQG